MSRWRRAVDAALAVNGLVAPAPAPVAAPVTLLALPAASTVSRSKPDRVLVLGAAGVLVTAKGRLPRDGEVEHDGAALRVHAKGGPVLVAGALRKVPATCRWVPVSGLHRVDLVVLRQVAPAHAHELSTREKIAVLVSQLVTAHGCNTTGDIASDLAAVLAIAERRA